MLKIITVHVREDSRRWCAICPAIGLVLEDATRATVLESIQHYAPLMALGRGAIPSDAWLTLEVVEATRISKGRITKENYYAVIASILKRAGFKQLETGTHEIWGYPKMTVRNVTVPRAIQCKLTAINILEVVGLPGSIIDTDNTLIPRSKGF